MIRSFESLLAGVLCAGALVCILIAGLWPFGHPRNDVTWLGNHQGIRFGKRGTVLSAGALPKATAQVCAVELWLRPSRSDGYGTILAFLDSLYISQSLADLRLEIPARGRASRIFAKGIFYAGKQVFLTILSTSGGTDIYLNGVLVRQMPGTGGSFCRGRFVVGDSPRENNTWEGDLRALAIYQQEFSPDQVWLDYQAWTAQGSPAEERLGKPEALYFFDENEGNLVHDHGKAGVGLGIPPRYVLADQILLESPWSAFEPTRAYVSDLLINVGGFMPFAFTFAAFLAATRRTTAVTGITVLAGFLLSITIETLQAFLPTRNSDLTDVLTNTLGTWFGAMLYQAWQPYQRQFFRSLRALVQSRI